MGFIVILYVCTFIVHAGGCIRQVCLAPWTRWATPRQLLYIYSNARSGLYNRQCLSPLNLRFIDNVVHVAMNWTETDLRTNNNNRCVYCYYYEKNARPGSGFFFPISVTVALLFGYLLYILGGISVPYVYYLNV